MTHYFTPETENDEMYDVTKNKHLMPKCLFFSEKLFVFKYCYIFIVLGSDTSSPSSIERQHRGSRPSAKGRSLPVGSGH